MQLVVRTKVWLNNLFLLLRYPDICSLLDGLVALEGHGTANGLPQPRMELIIIIIIRMELWNYGIYYYYYY